MGLSELKAEGQPGLQELVPGQVPKLQRNPVSEKKYIFLCICVCMSYCRWHGGKRTLDPPGAGITDYEPPNLGARN